MLIPSHTHFKFKAIPIPILNPNSTLNVHNPHGIKLLTRLQVGLSHLHEHKLRHNFQDSLNLAFFAESTIEFIITTERFITPLL